MSAANPSSTPGIAHERLNQIASRKLAALSILVNLGNDRRTLEGEFFLKTSQVLYPGTEQPLPRAKFVVRGHDHLRFLEPPLAALGEVMFYDLERPAQLEERLSRLLRDRMVALGKATGELRRLKLTARLDPQRLGLKAVVRVGQQFFELLALPSETRVTRVELSGGQSFNVSTDYPPLRFSDFPSLVELEQYLSNDMDRMRQMPVLSSAESRMPARVEPVAPAPGQITLAMLVQRFGADAVLSRSSKLELLQDVQVGPTRYRFTATREDGTTFRGQVSGPRGSHWSDSFDLEKFPGTARVVDMAVRTEAASTPAAAAAPPATSAPEPPAAPSPPRPHAGEVWAMSVLIEKETSDEIRYRCMDIEDKPYGAARVLKRADFESTFVYHGPNWRLLVLIDEVLADSVVYRQLDGQRQARGQQRRLATGILVATFRTEAAAS